MSYTVPESAYGVRPTAVATAASMMFGQAVVVLAVGLFACLTAFDAPTGRPGDENFLAAFRLPSGVVLGGLITVAVVSAGALALIARRLWRGVASARTPAAILQVLVLIGTLRITGDVSVGHGPALNLAGGEAVTIVLGAVLAVTAVVGIIALAHPSVARFRRGTSLLQ